MLPHQERVVTEFNDLADKLDKLVVFITTSPLFKGLNQEEQIRLTLQEHYMRQYALILQERIAAFKVSL